MKTQRTLITGASSGLGKALAVEMAEKGYEVILVGRSESKLHEVIREASAGAQSRMRALQADLAVDTEVAGVIERTRALFNDRKPLGILVNCAGYAVSGRIDDIPAKDYERCLKVNFSAPVSLTQQVLPEMRAAGQGLIVNVGSGVARRALPFVSPYCAAKAALLSFTDSLRVELYRENIKVMMFSPGPVTSGFHDSTVHRGTEPLHFPPFHGKSASEIGHQFLKAIEGNKDRVVLGMRASVAHHLNYWFPRFTDWLIARMYRVGANLAHTTPTTAKRAG